MKVLFLHGKESGPGGTKAKFLIEHGFTVINPALPKDDFEASIRIAQAAFDEHNPAVVVGSSRGGAVAMNINSGNAGIVLLAPAWRNWGAVKTVKPRAIVIHSRQDEIIPFADSEALVASSPKAVLVEIGDDHRLSTFEPLTAMLEAVRKVASLVPADNIIPAQFNPPPGSEFSIGSNVDGDAPVFEILVPDGRGKLKAFGPDGKPGPMARLGRSVSESEFWSAVTREEQSLRGIRAGGATDAQIKKSFGAAQLVQRSDGGGPTP